MKITTTPTGYGPIDRSPNSLTPPHTDYDPAGPTEYRSALLQALDGIELGEYDRRIVDWLAGWDTSVVAVVVSLLHRVRAAGIAEYESALNDAFYDRDEARDELEKLHSTGGAR